MELTKQLEKEVKEVYEAFWESLLNVDMKRFNSFLADDFKQIGTTEAEVFFNKKEAAKFLKATKEQVVGNIELRNRNIKIEALDKLILITEQSYAYVKIDEVWTYYAKTRGSSLLQKKDMVWKFIQMHISFPDTRADVGETIGLEKIAKENLELRDAIKRRTIELENKNRELEIETALEKVRSIALGMKEPADMPEVCKIIAQQLDKLGAKEIRNVQTAIFYESKGTYMNYEYYAKHGKTIITETSYTNHKIHQAFAEQMLRGKGEVYSTHISKAELNDWIAYQKTTNVFIDSFLETASSLNYYWHSLGPVALGISTYSPLSKNDLGLFNRFLNVFELAYTRYMDIERALAQAREAQIEASLERVRAVAMAMHNSEDLSAIGKTVFTELKNLGFTTIRNTEMVINNDEKETVKSYHYSDYGKEEIIEIGYKENPIVKKWANDLKKADDVFVPVSIPEKEMIGWNKYRKELGYKTDPKMAGAKAVHYYSYSIGLGALSISTWQALEDGYIKILERFRNVFNLSYKRYIDIQKAEAQAREAQIEASLEKVRAQAMGMHKPDDLLNVCKVMFTELSSLGFHEIRNAIIHTFNDEKKYFIDYDYSALTGGVITNISYSDHPIIKRFLMQIRKSDEAFAEITIAGKELTEWKKFRKSGGQPDDPRLNKTDALYYYIYSVGTGDIGISTFSSISEEKLKLLRRFRNVFEFAYKRYMDVATAEAQAREAQIEAALERVRSRTMAMHKSDELSEVSALLYNELQGLGVTRFINCGYVEIDETNKVQNAWMTNADGSGLSVVRLPLTGDKVFDERYDAWKRKGHLFHQSVGGELLKSHIEFATQHYRQTEIDELVRIRFADPTIFYCSNFSHGYLHIITDALLSGEAELLLMRFTRVFEMTYKRFLDLQKAEAQAREAQIEAALERIRARTMGMHKSDELQETNTIIFKQIESLGIPLIGDGIHVCHINEPVSDAWMSDPLKGQMPKIRYDHTQDRLSRKMYDGWKKGETFLEVKAHGEELQEHFAYILPLVHDPEVYNEIIPAVTIFHFAYFSHGFLVFVTREQCPQEHSVFIRFAKVFEQTYTRFLDLQRAEAQAREAKIEVALETIRSRSLSMQKSEELSLVIREVLKKFQELGITMESRVAIIIELNNDSRELNQWVASPNFSVTHASTPYTKHIILDDLWNAWESGVDFYTKSYPTEVKNSYFNYLFKHSSFKDFENIDETRLWILEQEFYSLSLVFEKNSSIGIANYTNIPLSKDEINIVERFSKVFEQAYVRFLDLQKAEAQAREAQIEAALERVRSRTMGMQKSEELKEVIQVVYEQFVHLNINIEHTGFVIDYKARDDYDIWIADPLGVPSRVTVPYFDSVYYNRFNEAKEKGEDFFATNLSFEEKNRFYQKLFEYVPGLPEQAKEFYFSCPGLAASTVLLDNVCLYIENFSGISYSDEENATLMRFGKVFQQTYTRFLDLQKAEAHAKEVELEKKRSEDLLLNILPREIANELKQFGKSYARKHEQVSILFTDIKGFSTISETLSAEELVNQLDECFRAFDHIVGKHGLEKIKTIGDAYICACGLPNPDPDNAVKTVRAAIDMLDFAKGFGMTKIIQDLPAFEFRVGIHTGPVITGVVGLKKFTYDIWGDAVNMAARMEQHGEAGRINISGNTYQLVKDKFTCTHRGKIPAKNKGEVDMYFVEKANN
ncbi:MAG: nuclear transport factor 2 family protein [Sphingobacteriales bacterium]|nr:nuclear transport factor 2 family protein [Sphingobacteriales bacterium]